jgi:hypothetical protein
MGGCLALVNIELGESALVIPRQKAKEMLTVREEGGVTYVKINSSSLQLIQECLRKSRYALHEKWKPEGESPALTFGSAIHKALEIYYRGDVADRKLPSLSDLESLAFNAPTDDLGLIERAIVGFVEKAQPLTQLPDSDKRSILNGIWILHSYFKTYLDDPYIIHHDAEGPFTERTFTLNIFKDASLIIDIFGTIDFIFRHVTNGNIIVGDHKTNSALNFGGSSFFDRDKPNHQYSFYALAAREVFKLDTNEFLVNVIEVKARPKTVKGKGPNFPRQITTRNDDDFAELKEAVVYYVRQYLEACKTGVFPLGPVNACNSYGSCLYRQVCASPISLRQNILNAKFKREDSATV